MTFKPATKSLPPTTTPEYTSQPSIEMANNLNGNRTIQNVAWEARYADLSGHQANGRIVGFEFNGGLNQKVVMLFYLSIFYLFSHFLLPVDFPTHWH